MSWKTPPPRFVLRKKYHYHYHYHYYYYCYFPPLSCGFHTEVDLKMPTDYPLDQLQPPVFHHYLATGIANFQAFSKPLHQKKLKRKLALLLLALLLRVGLLRVGLLFLHWVGLLFLYWVGLLFLYWVGLLFLHWFPPFDASRTQNSLKKTNKNPLCRCPQKELLAYLKHC